jgi:hypothetical protein
LIAFNAACAPLSLRASFFLGALQRLNMMKSLLRLLLLTAASALLFSACATQTLPTAQQMQSLKSIEVVLAVPEKNFAALQANGSYVYVLPGGGISSGSAVGIGLVANLITAGIDYAAFATAREAAEPVGSTIDDIDLRRTVFSHLQSQLPASRSATLTLTDAAMPKPEDGQTYESALIKSAALSKADATLYLTVAPLFRTNNDPYPRTYSQSILVSRAGEILMTTRTQFAGPKPPDAERAEVVRWWADSRYRRFLLYSVQAVLTPVADALAPTEAQQARGQRLREKIKDLPLVTVSSTQLRSSRCAFDSEQPKLVRRHEQLRQYVFIIALCEQDDQAKVKETIEPAPSLANGTLGRSSETLPYARSGATTPVDPDLIWTTLTSGATPAAVSRIVAR